MKRLVMYESVPEQELNGFSLEEQINDILSYGKELGFTIDRSNIVCDPGQSAGTLKRPGLQDILLALPKKQIKRIIIKNSSRLTREPIDKYSLKKVFSTYQVEVICLEGRWVPQSANEEIGTEIQVYIDAHNRRQVSPDTIRGMRQSALEGNWSIGGRAPRGFKKVDNVNKPGKHLEPIEEQTKYITYIFESLKNHTQTKQSLAKLYNRNHVLGVHWTDDDINTIFNSKLNYGTFEKWGLLIDGYVQGHISKELFEEAHEAQRKQTRVPKHFYVYGGLVYCEHCHYLCSRESVVKKNKKVTEKVYLYHLCPICKKRISDNKLDICISTFIDLKALPKEKINLIEVLVEQIKRKEKRISIYESDYDNMLINEEELKDKILAIKKEISQKKSEINKIKNLNPKKFSDLSDLEKRKVVLKHIDKIIVNFDEKNFPYIKMKNEDNQEIINNVTKELLQYFL